MKRRSERARCPHRRIPAARLSPALTSLPRLEDLPQAPGGGYDADRVRDAFDAFRRHSAQLQAQLRVLQAAGRTGQRRADRPRGSHGRPAPDPRPPPSSPTRSSATPSRPSSNQLARTEEEVSKRQRELQDREAEIERYRQESERQRAEITNAARNEARELLQNSQRDASPGGSRVRGTRHAAGRAGTPSGDRAHERRPRRGRADARVGARPGRDDHGPRAAGSRAVPGLRRSRRVRDRARRRIDRSRRRPRVRGWQAAGHDAVDRARRCAAGRTDPGAAVIAQGRRPRPRRRPPTTASAKSRSPSAP